MSEEYTLISAIKDEIATLKELEKFYDKEESWLTKSFVVGQYRSLNRIVNRYENGHEYYLGVKDGETQLMYRKTTRHLEQKYPAVAIAKQNLDTIVALVKDENNAT